MNYEDYNLPLFNWISKLLKCPYKQRYIAWAAKCSTKPLSKLLTSIFTAVKMGLQKYHDTCTCFSRSCVSQMRILINSKDLLEALKSKSQYVCNNIKTIFLYLIYHHSTNPTKNVELRNWFSVASQRRTKNKGISILSLVEINLTLSKVIQNLIININRTRSKIKLYDNPYWFHFSNSQLPINQ